MSDLFALVSPRLGKGDKVKNSSTRFDNLRVVNFSYKDSNEVESLLNRSMKLQVNIQDGDLMISAGDLVVYMTQINWKEVSN